MKQVFYWVWVLVWISSCAPNPEKQALSILEKSIEAHGGQAAWEEISLLKFNKMTRLLNGDGTVESEMVQEMEFRFDPYFEGKITWEKDSLSHKITFDGTNIHYYMGGNEVQNEGFLSAKKKEFDAAFYTVAQPWKLLEEPTALRYEGQKTLENGQLVESVKVNYGPDADQWWYYFDPISFQMVASEVHTKDHKSLIYDLEERESGDLKWHGIRKSYRIDDLGKKLFLRAEYEYSAYQVVKK